MIRFIKNIELKPYHTFAITAQSDYFFEFTESDDLVEFLEKNSNLSENTFTIGGGSNLLFVDDFHGLIYYPNIPGIYKVDEDRAHVWVEAGAGVIWDDFVEICVAKGWGGIENLSNIPGKIGSTPVQNIGAYNAEVHSSIELVRGIDLSTARRVEFTHDECKFGYRDSIFKNELFNRVIITSVLFKLDKFPQFNLEYGALQTEVEKLGKVTIQTIREAIISIRTSKLPDPLIVGNAGSFFKNPIAKREIAEELKLRYPLVPIFETSSNELKKIAAGWLIEQAGWKGYREGDAGVHPHQALVLVNYGNATGRNIVDLSDKICTSVFEKFGIKLEPEVNILR